MDSRLRGNDGKNAGPVAPAKARVMVRTVPTATPSSVIPAQAEMTARTAQAGTPSSAIPAEAGITVRTAHPAAPPAVIPAQAGIHDLGNRNPAPHLAPQREMSRSVTSPISVEVERHVVPSPPVSVTSPRLRLSCRFARMLGLKTIIPVCFALLLAACGGGGHLSVELPPGGRTLDLEFRPGSASQHPLPFRISGGIPPYEPSIDGCPDWVTLFTDQAILAGTAPTQDRGKIFHCTYRVTETDPGFRPARSVSYGLRLMVGPGHELTLPQVVVPDKEDNRISLERQEPATIGPFPRASGGVPPYTYSFTCAGGMLPSGMGFAPETRRFAGTPDTHFYDSCAYTVTDSSQPAATVSRAVEVEVTGGETGPLRLPDFPDSFDDDESGKIKMLTLQIGRRSQITFQMASGGVEPYTYELADCTLPAGLEFHPNTRVLSGTPNAEYRGPNCTYRVTDSASPPASVSLSFVLIVEPLEEGDWRFRTRTVEPGGHA